MNGFWDWAVRAYARPAVAEACLALQDEHGQNVPLVLWIFWASEAGHEPDIESGARLASAWDASAGRHLREARRALKAPLPGLADAERETFRARLKVLELAGERMLMTALEPLITKAPAGDCLALLAQASREYGAAAPAEVFRPLLARL